MPRILAFPGSAPVTTTNSFSTIQPPNGTSPTASSPTDTLTLTSNDGTVVITGNSGTDTVDFSAPGAGNVTGPASSTDNAIVRWNGTTGQLIQDSVFNIDDGGVMRGTSFSDVINFVNDADNSKILVLDLTTMATSVSTTLRSQIQVNGLVLTIPQLNASDSIMFNSFAATVRGKLLRQDNFFIDTVATKKAGWDLSGATASTTTTMIFAQTTNRSITFPDATGTIALLTTVAPIGAQYVTLATDATLTNERVLTAGTGITVTDAGAGSTVTIATTITQYTDEMAQDAVGAMVANSSKISLTYVDATPSLTADVIAGSLVNADINASAAIAFSKLAALTSGNVLFGVTNVATSTALNTIAVTALTGTANQITASASVGSVTLSFPSLLKTVNVEDLTFSIKDNSDNTKIAQFEASGITTGTTRTYTFPNASGTLALTASSAPFDAQYVTLATDGTLSNERVLTGTALQVTVTDNGAGSTVVLSIPNPATVGALTTGALSSSSIQGTASSLQVTGGTGVSQNLKLKSNSSITVGRIEMLDSVLFDGADLKFSSGTVTFTDTLNRTILNMTSTVFQISTLTVTIDNATTINSTATIATSATVPIVYGSSASGGTLNVNSTSNATKGTITLDTFVVLNGATTSLTVTGGAASPTNTISITRNTATTGINRCIDFANANSATAATAEVTGARCLSGYAGTNVATTVQGFDMTAYCGTSVSSSPPSTTARASNLFGAQFTALNNTTNTGTTSRLAGAFLRALNHGPSVVTNFYGVFAGVEQTDPSGLGGQTVTNMYLGRYSFTNGSSGAYNLTSGTITNPYGLYVEAYEDGAGTTYTNPPKQLNLLAAGASPAGAIAIYQADTVANNRFLSPNSSFGQDTLANATIDAITDIISPTYYGSNSASGTLTLSSTKNATKSKIFLNSAQTSTYDELNDRLGLLTSSPTNILSASGQAARTFWMERHTTSNTAGNNLTLQAGGATSGATDKAGGQLVLAPGANTGTGRSNVTVKGYTVATATGTSDGTQIDRECFGCFKGLTNNSAIALVNFTLASNTVIAGVIRYAIEVFNGTDLQVEEGLVSFHSINKGGVFSNNTVTKFGNQQAATSGTLTVTFAIGAANPSQLTCNANSSLTPSAGYPRVTYTLENLTQQAISIQ